MRAERTRAARPRLPAVRVELANGHPWRVLTGNDEPICGECVQAWPFVPLKIATRFLVGFVDWPEWPSGEPRCWVEPPQLNKLSRDSGSHCNEFIDDQREDVLSTREAAFAWAADFNQKPERRRHSSIADWAVVFECADPLPAQLRHLWFDATGVGYMEPSPISPIRLVTPTAAELRAHRIEEPAHV